MSVSLEFGRDLKWTATQSFFGEIFEAYCPTCPSDSAMIHELDMTYGVGGNSLDKRGAEYVAAFLNALEKSARHLLGELRNVAQDYPDDPAVKQKIEAHQRLLQWIAWVRSASQAES